MDSSGSVSLSGSKPEMTSFGPEAASPPSAAPQGGSLPQQFQEQVAQDMASRALQGAGRALRTTAGEIVLYVESNHYSVTVFSFIGGLVLALVSFFNLLAVWNFVGGPLSYVLNVYELIFGLIIMLIDGPGDRVPSLRNKVLSHAGFLHTNSSRSIFYMFIACLEGKEEGVFRTAVAWYFACIAIGHMILAVHKRRTGHTQGMQEHLAAPSNA
mmetsp:Transcript_76609/g.135161  ORF Transcript_76609/g.135161 Transcript_76609/m.135161 type:complete len:213 (-) Transcript_76609:60-698(-)